MSGYSFPLPYPLGPSNEGNLHLLYDTALFRFTNEMKPPFTKTDLANINLETDTLLELHPADTLSRDVNNQNFTNWAQESFQFVKHSIY